MGFGDWPFPVSWALLGPEEQFVEDSTVQPADPGITGATETPDAGATSAPDANPFPWESAGFGNVTSAAAVSDAPAPNGHPATDAEKPAGVTSEGTTAEPPADGQEAKPTGAPADEAVKPEEQAASESTDSPGGRRQAARERDAETIATQQAEIDAAVQRALTAERDAEAARVALAAREDADRQSAARLAELRGDDAEFNRRQAISNRMWDANYTGPTLTTDEAAELARWTATRELQRPFEDAAQRNAASWVDQEIDGQRRQWITQAVAVADEIGLPRAELGKPENRDLGALLKVTADTVSARIREAEVAPLQEKVSQLEATVRQTEDKLVHAQRSPVIGGRSDGGLVPGTGAGWDPSLPWDANLNRPPAPAEANA